MKNLGYRFLAALFILFVSVLPAKASWGTSGGTTVSTAAAFCQANYASLPGGGLPTNTYQYLGIQYSQSSGGVVADCYSLVFYNRGGPPPYYAVLVAQVNAVCGPGQSYDMNAPSGCSTSIQSGKQIGADCDCSTGDVKIGEPVDVASGNVSYKLVDYETTGANKLSFVRYYNSRGAFAGELGPNWRTNYDSAILNVQYSTAVSVQRADGKTLNFTLSGSTWVCDSDVDYQLTNSGSVWTLKTPDDTVETYSFNGGTTSNAQLVYISRPNGYTQSLLYNSNFQLASVTDSYNRKLTFSYGSNNQLSSIGTPDGTTIQYGYGSSNNIATPLVSVTYPTSQTLTYVYDASTPNELTEVLDENNNQFLKWTYDAYGRGLSSQVGNGSNANLTTISYNDTTGARTVTNALGVAETYSFTTLQDAPKVTGISRAATATTAAATRTFTFDGNGYLASMTDWNGNQTTYVNNSHGLPTTVNEAVGSSVARTTTIAYDPTWAHLPDTITMPGVTISYTYDSYGEPLTKKLTDTTTTTTPYSTNGQTRTSTYTWSNFLLASVQNPRTDVTAKTLFTYGTDGALLTVTDTLGHVTNITSHTGGGLPLTVVDPNNVTTTLAYDGRQRITSSAVSTAGGTRTTSWAYYNSNTDFYTTNPDNSGFWTLHDNAHRVDGISDNLSNQAAATLDALGDPVVTELNNSSSQPFYRTATFDALGRKLKDTSYVTGASYTSTFDKNGNALTVVDPLGHTTTRLFDALNRLYKSTDVSSGVSQWTFDAHDRPLSVSDPNSHVTSYVYDGFGDRIEEVSPDKGTTVYHFDGDGNLTQKVDGASVTTNYTYDKLDRPLTTIYPADTTLNVAFTYDQTGTPYGKGVGRLTSLTDAAGSLSRYYDERGNILTEKRINGTNTLTTAYTYDAASRIASITYPSGAVSSYTRDAAGYVTTMPFSATGTDLTQSVSAATHLPFGPVNSILYDQGDSGTFTYDKDYRLTKLEYDAYGGTAYLKWVYAYDNANNVSSITDNITAANSQTLGYDTLNRITSAASSGTYGSLTWTYDHNGNVLTHNLGSTAYTYGYGSGTNRMTTISFPGYSETLGYTGTGNMNALTVNGANYYTLSYNKANRLTSVTGSGVTVAMSGAVYDAFGKRITKTDSGSPAVLYSYDLDGNLIEEKNGSTVTDYIYLDGINVANWAPSEGHLYAINFDSRGVPQVSRDEYGLTNWAAYSQPYGSMTATITSGLYSGPVTQSLRLPGQYYDNEAAFHYNGFRDLIPGVGRYGEADPIGLAGGLNPYRYAEANPMRYNDRNGSQSATDWITSPVDTAKEAAVSDFIQSKTNSSKEDADDIAKVCISVTNYLMEAKGEWGPGMLIANTLWDQVKDDVKQQVLDDPKVRNAEETVINSGRSYGTDVSNWINSWPPLQKVNQILSR